MKARTQSSNWLQPIALLQLILDTQIGTGRGGRAIVNTDENKNMDPHGLRTQIF
jgi:hypothetical protein